MRRREGRASLRATTAVACVALALGALGSAHALVPEAPSPGARARVLSMSPLGDAALRSAVIRSLQAHASRRFDLVPDGEGGWLAREDGVELVVGDDGVALRGPGMRAHLGVVALGRAAAPVAARGEVESVYANEARVRLGAGALERWVHGPLGLEHLVELSERAPGTGPFVVELALDGSLRPRAGARGLELVDGADVVRGRYTDAWAEDAGGRMLPIALETDGVRIRLVVDDTAAAYPIVIDPVLWLEQATLSASDAAASDTFGASVAISGDRAIVGAGLDDVGGNANQGSAYVYVRSGTSWTEEAHLFASDGVANGLFGGAVALDGTTAVVAASNRPGGLSFQGFVYVFVRGGTGWTEQAILGAFDGEDDDNLGSSVAISGDRVIAGAPTDDVGSASVLDAGGAYVFERTGTIWSAGQLLRASDRLGSDGFGTSVAIWGNWCVIGSPGDDVSGRPNQGSVYLFERSSGSWTQRQQISFSGASSDAFGTGVAMHETRMLVGAPGAPGPGGVRQGAVYGFILGATWGNEGLPIRASDGATNDAFGGAVAVFGNIALVGSPRTGSATDPGSAYVFARRATGWTEEGRLLASAGAAGDATGTSVSVSGASAILGSPMRDSGATDRGAAHVFTDPTNGMACTTAAECGSALCVDGVCCSSACGAGATDCQACRVAAGGTRDGTCTPLTAVAAAARTCRPAAGTCDLAETCTDTSTTCPADVIATSGAVCRAVSGACDVAEVCSGATVACPGNGFVAAAVTCRAATGDCDAPELCPGTSAACGANVLVPSGTSCRPSAGDCDVAETCTGADVACPVDAFVAASTVCRATGGPCDLPEACSGAGATCPGDGRSLAGAICRGSAGACDPAERCDGAAVTCPGDVRAPSGSACGGSTGGSCSTPGTCDGTAASCGGGTPLPAGTSCLPRDASRPCDVDDVCDGTSDACPALFAAASTTCGPAATDVCDAPDHCAGTSADCVAVFLLDVECRAASGACDAIERCSGAGPSCPTDDVESAGMVCRASSDGTCDPAEVCDGASASCPADVSTCADAGMTDAGSRDAGGMTRDAAGSDGGSAMADAGAPPVATEGCSCRVTSRARPLAVSVALALALALLGRRVRAARRA